MLLDPKGYCWSHGQKVIHSHTRNNFTTRRKGNKEEATKTKIWEGAYQMRTGSKFNDRLR